MGLSLVGTSLMGASLMGAAALGGCSTLTTYYSTTARKQALGKLGFVEAADGWELNLSGRLLFALNDANLSAEGTETIEQVAKVLLGIGIDHLTVEGHADNVGTDESNMKLSERRAEVVAQALVEKGFEAANIERRAFGSQRPIADNTSEAGRAQNRRAALIVASL
jgi:outer membrane protein OmpA-like peptidoglycan-associated protein